MKEAINTDILIANIIKAIEDIKGEDILLMDLREIENKSTDYFIICSGTSNTHVQSIANAVEKDISKEFKEKPWHVEGAEVSEWVLLDYVNVVVHVFQKPIREFYNIEGLWGDAKTTKISN
ncbi:MAG: ribosome silencing factor [Bacteroidota bacterium]